MNTPTPTANPSGATAPHVPAPPLPAGLPDPAALAALATEFFHALPGVHHPETPAQASTASVPSALPALAPVLASAHDPAPPGSPLSGPGGTGTGIPGAAPPHGKVAGTNLLPSSPANVLTLGNRAPALAPHAVAQNGLPDNVTQIAPALDPRIGGVALGVPEAHGVAAHPQTLAAASASPFYFIGDGASALPAAPPVSVPDLPGDLDIASGISPHVPGSLPTEHELAALAVPYTATPDAARAVSASSTPSSLYVLDEALASHPYRHPHHAQLAASPFASAHPPFDVHAVRRDFPILQERVNGKQLVWLDNAATTQKPQAVIDRLAYFYAHENSNVHRAAHALAARATDAYENARITVQKFINAASHDEIIFVRGATEAINLVAKTWGVQNIGEGDEIIVSHLEHHANIVPWQQLVAQTGAKLRVIPVDDSGQVLLDEYRKLLNSRTKLVSVAQVANATGTVLPTAEIVELAHRAGAKALVDGAQSVSHLHTDVQALDADFFVFSGHKIYGPTGIGVVYGKRDLLEATIPWQGGGNMIADVTFERTLFQPPPHRFEAGTGNIADAAGLGAALDYVSRVGIGNIARYEHDLLTYATSRLVAVPGVRIVGTAREKASVLSFVLQGYTTTEIGQALSAEGIAVRAGHHCAQPILRRLGLESTVRPSLAFYNTCADVDALVDVVQHLATRRER